MKFAENNGVHEYNQIKLHWRIEEEEEEKLFASLCLNNRQENQFTAERANFGLRHKSCLFKVFKFHPE